MTATEPTSRPSSGSKSISFDLPAHSITDPNSNIMNVPRPKSAKGRSHSNSAYVHGTETCSYPVPIPTTFSDWSGCPSSSPPAPVLYPHTRITRVTKEEVPELLHPLPSRPSSSLNRYRVLPSIGTSVIRTKTPDHNVDLNIDFEEKLSLHGEKKPSHLKSKSATSKEHSLVFPLDEPSESEPKLRLAVRYPSGQRFECCFRPTDTLQTILSVAEWRSDGDYRNFVVETMDVPRRSFNDLSKTLKECGIQNKSVLCILHDDDD
ncbi:UBX domain-containing protein 10 [Mobula birostris]|uniref:UBX domain-containing protein 10 n=1 Tax=Mobula birostris TaxID=1983395 RepID=UPI003B27C09C